MLAHKELKEKEHKDFESAIEYAKAEAGAEAKAEIEKYAIFSTATSPRAHTQHTRAMPLLTASRMRVGRCVATQVQRARQAQPDRGR